MSTDFGTPPLAQKNRILVDQRLKDVRQAGGVSETVTIDFRGQTLHVEVIDMPTASLFYNPATHRIRAQRSHDPARDRELNGDPWSTESQAYLEFLLKALPADPSKPDPEFHGLLGSLREFKQKDPGLITHDGILVNGNTRCAALKQLGAATMRVGVLPESCTWDDINAVELSLQLRKDHRRKYSYINELLAIDEQLALGRPIEDIAREFRIRTSTCRQDIWILSQLRDLIDRSGQEDVRLRLLDFEDAEEKLRELHRRYEKDCAAGSKNNADLLKENRLAAIALAFSKTDIREIDHTFRNLYLDNYLPESFHETASAAPVIVTVPGLNRTIKSASADVSSARRLTDAILQAKAVQIASDHVTVERSAEASKLISEIRDAFKDAVDAAKDASRIRKRRQAAPDRITDACRDLEQCVTDLVVSRGSNSLDEESLDEAVQVLRTTLGRLALECSRSIKVPGEGVSWLLDTAAAES